MNLSHEFNLAFSLIAASWITEDGALISSLGFIATKQITPALGLLAPYVGILSGDIALYSVGRFFSRRLANRHFTSPFFEKALLILRRQNGSKMLFPLFIARCIPGLRLPTILAAGIAQVPFIRATTILAASTALWVGFWTLPLWGVREIQLPSHISAALIFVILGTTSLALLSLRSTQVRRKIHVRFLKLASYRYFEFWPAWFFYMPIVALYAYLAARYRSVSLPTAVNPMIEMGGLIGEAKSQILEPLKKIPEAQNFVLKSTNINPQESTDLAIIMERLRLAGLGFPLVMKPDFGQRGSGVQLITRVEEAMAYIKTSRDTVIAQELCDYPGELGVFYVKKPGEPRGRILSITEKFFPVITGDGISTVAELVLAHPRARWMAGVYLHRHRTRCEEILKSGETLKLVFSGNHCQGAIFLDATPKITPELEASFTRVMDRLDGFQFGRIDVKFKSFEELSRGEGWKIIEVNGAGAEMTHIYQPGFSLFEAYRVLFKQWAVLFEIGDRNREAGLKPCGWLKLAKELFLYQSRKKFHPETL